MVCTKKLIGLAVVMIGGKLKQTVGLHHTGTGGSTYPLHKNTTKIA